MEFKLLLLLSVFSLISCSGDDTTPVNTEKNLVSTIAYNYAPNGSLGSRIENYFQENKLFETLIYNGNSLSFKNVYEYGNGGQISVLKRYDMFNNLSMTTSYQYDTNGKLTETIMTDILGGGSYINIYTYNDNNTVTKTNTSSGTIVFQYVYHINDSGKIYKITDGDDVIQEVEYLGNNINWWNNSSDIISFVYDNDHEVKGAFLNASKNLMSLYEHNNILDSGFTNLTIGKDKYVIHQINSNGENEQSFQYEFDAEGYPVEKRVFLDGQTQPNMVIEINYESS